jgi:surfactin synthase thioesterase subunit
LDDEIDVANRKLAQSPFRWLALVHRVPGRHFFPHEDAQAVLKIVLYPDRAHFSIIDR